MDLVYCVALLGLALVMSVALLLGVRKPVEPAWAAEWAVANVWCVAITGLISFGMSFGVRFAFNLNYESIGLLEIGLIAGFVSAYVGILHWMAPRRRLAEYAARTGSNSGVAHESFTGGGMNSAVPAGGGKSPNEPDLPRAA